MVAASTDATDLAGKSVIIAGGTTGIGLATAKRLAAEGAKVFIFGRHEQALNDALKQMGGESHGITADQSRGEDVERVFREADARFGECDILINNAAVTAGPVGDKQFDEMRYALETNVLGYFACTHEAINRMKRRGGGHIVNVGSMSADLREPGGEIYVATKAAIQAFSESLRKTANKENIRVTLIEPGAVATPLQDKSPQEEREKIAKMGMIEPDDVARCVVYCLQQPLRVDVVSIQIRPLKQLI
jgi:NADP-dependent 3-hydroxy acid dehydrogenase YdfG